MKRIHTYESFLNENASATLETVKDELRKYKSTFESYCNKEERDEDIKKRALEFLDEIMVKAETDAEVLQLANDWFTKESTLVLQELFRKTIGVEKFREIWNGNSPEQLRDFNAFTLLDTVSSYNKKN